MSKYYKIYIDGVYVGRIFDLLQWAKAYLNGVITKDYPNSKIEIREGDE